jgi:hypothetical protein
MDLVSTYAVYSEHKITENRNRSIHLLPYPLHHVLWYIPSLFWALPILFLSGCCPHVLPEMEYSFIDNPLKQIHFSSPSEGSTLDIFTFENDRLKRLDSYKRIERFEGDTVYAESTGGNKIIFCCLATCKDIYDWAQINSYSAMAQIRFDLEDERRAALTRTGECRIRAGETGGQTILRPLVGAVCIERISCDFSGTPYAGSNMTDVCAYLTNINGTYGANENEVIHPQRIINHGMLKTSDLDAFIEKDLIFSPVTDVLTSHVLHPEICFLCYPNNADGSSIGNPCTRLVIEGKIDGHTYYWPIDINQSSDNEICGIERNCRYSFDILIRKKGTSDPDIPIQINECEIKFKLKPWEEKKEYGIRF